MFASILVGTDGSDTATTAVRYAIDLAAQLGARLLIVSAYEPVSGQRLRGERVPEQDLAPRPVLGADRADDLAFG
jgi:nucleotide-binding universal stress UspA family protein